MDNRIGISYCRKSIKPKGTYDDKESILYQEKVIEDYCDQEGIQLVKRFSDIGYSGKTIQRPELIKMLELLETEEMKIDVLLFYTVDRLGRDFRNNISLVLKITEYVKEIVFVSEGMTNTYDYFKMFLMMKSVMAEEERIALLNRVMQGRKAVVLYRETFRGANKPLGYTQKNKEELVLSTFDKTKDLKELQAFEAVQFIFLAYLSNMSMREIAKKVNEQFGLTKRGKDWDVKSISYILKNDIYAGILSGKFRNEAYHLASSKVEPLLEKNLYHFLKGKLEQEKPGRKPKAQVLPLLSVCLECLKPLELVGSEIICRNCNGSIEASLYREEVRRYLSQYLFGNFNNRYFEQRVHDKQLNLLLKKKGIEDELKQLANRKSLIIEMFSNDPELLKGLLMHNESQKAQLDQEYQRVTSFAEFLSNDLELKEDTLWGKQDSLLLLHLPYLILVDLESNQIFLKFHSCVFEEESIDEGNTKSIIGYI